MTESISKEDNVYTIVNPYAELPPYIDKVKPNNEPFYKRFDKRNKKGRKYGKR